MTKSRPARSAADLLVEYVAAHNDGVRRGDFRALVALFARDAVFSFHGIPVGPFVGADAIGGAFRDLPPTDTLRLSGVEPDSPKRVRASYAWDSAPDRIAGRYVLESDAGQIRSLDVFA